MTEERKMILLGANANKEQISIDAGMANRHGLITGATGTGKTVSLQVAGKVYRFAPCKFSYHHHQARRSF